MDEKMRTQFTALSQAELQETNGGAQLRMVCQAINGKIVFSCVAVYSK